MATIEDTLKTAEASLAEGCYPETILRHLIEAIRGLARKAEGGDKLVADLLTPHIDTLYKRIEALEAARAADLDDQANMNAGQAREMAKTIGRVEDLEKEKARLEQNQSQILGVVEKLVGKLQGEGR